MSLDRAMLAKIHIAKKELGFDDDTYRTIMQTRYKKDSAAKLTRFEANDLMDHFKRAGFRVKRRTHGHGRTTNSNGDMTRIGSLIGDRVPGTGVPVTASTTYEKPMARKVVAIWITLALAGKLRNGSDAALQSYVKRMTGVDHLSWCDDRDLWMLIEALKKWAKREKVDLDE